MNKKINRVKIFSNHNPHSEEITKLVKEALEKEHFQVVSDKTDKYDLAIAIGGDGSFLRMVKETEFDSNIYYVGINAGTLGFLQEVKVEDISRFVQLLKERAFDVTEIGIQETKVETMEEEYFFYSLNELVVRDSKLNTCHLRVEIDHRLLEHYVGDGMLVATSIGSTAYNLSFGGSIVFDDFHALQLTPIAPLNSKVYRSLTNSVIIPENRLVSILPDANNPNLLITIDGENYWLDSVQRIDTVVDKKKIRCLRFEQKFVDKVHNKFLD